MVLIKSSRNASGHMPCAFGIDHGIIAQTGRGFKYKFFQKSYFFMKFPEKHGKSKGGSRKNPYVRSVGSEMQKRQKRCGAFPLRIRPLWPCAPVDDLHDNGRWVAALNVFSASNVHPSSKRGREACNPTEKSSVPMIRCGSKWAHHAPSRD